MMAHTLRLRPRSRSFRLAAVVTAVLGLAIVANVDYAIASTAQTTVTSEVTPSDAPPTEETVTNTENMVVFGPASTPVSDCVVNPVFTYTFGSATGSGVITATGGNVDDELCSPLYVRPVAWDYDVPASGSPSWSQTLHGYNDVTVDKIGTFPYAPPQIETCRQYDVYASFDGWGALAVPESLLGPNNPFEPQFLHQALAGMGPNPTWSYTSSEGCNPPPPTVQQCQVQNPSTHITSLLDPSLYFEDRAGGSHVLTSSGIGIEWAGPDLSQAKSAGYVLINGGAGIPFGDIGSPYLNYTNESGADAGLNLVIYDGTTWKGTIVYEPGNSITPYWSTFAIPGFVPPDGTPSYRKAVGTPDEFLNAFINAGWNAKVVAIGYSGGSGSEGKGTVQGFGIGCDSWTFGRPEAPTPGAYDEVIWDEQICSIEGGGTVNGVHNFYEQAPATWNEATQSWVEGEYSLVRSVPTEKPATPEECPPPIELTGTVSTVTDSCQAQSVTWAKETALIAYHLTGTAGPGNTVTSTPYLKDTSGDYVLTDASTWSYTFKTKAQLSCNGGAATGLYGDDPDGGASWSKFFRVLGAVASVAFVLAAVAVVAFRRRENEA